MPSNGHASSPVSFAVGLWLVLGSTMVVWPARADWPPNGKSLGPCDAMWVSSDGAAGMFCAVPNSAGSFANDIGPDGGQAAGWDHGPVVVVPRVFPYEHYTLDAAGVAQDGEGGEWVLVAEGIPCEAHCAFEPGWLYVQHLGTGGTLPLGWPRDGKRVFERMVDPGFAYGAGVAAASDGRHGLILGWTLSTDHSDVLVQALDPDGERRWGDDGITLARVPRGADNPAIVSDGSGGVFAFWLDPSSGPAIMGQHVTADGRLAWGDGLRISSAVEAPTSAPVAVDDGTNGAFIAWSAGLQLRIARVTQGGGQPWREPRTLTATAMDLDDLQLASVAGGAVAIWVQRRHGFGAVLGQRVTRGGTIAWPPGGAVVSDAPGSPGRPAVTSDGAQGAYVAWDDARRPFEIYATHLGADGQPLPGWLPDGSPIASGSAWVTTTRMIASPPRSAIVHWRDLRSYQGGVAEVAFAMRLDPSGPAATPPPASPARTQAADVENVAPTAAAIAMRLEAGARVRFTLPDVAPAVLDVLDITGRRVGAVELRGRGGEVTAPIPAGSPAGIYLVRIRQGPGSVTRRLVLTR